MTLKWYTSVLLWCVYSLSALVFCGISIEGDFASGEVVVSGSIVKNVGATEQTSTGATISNLEQDIRDKYGYPITGLGFSTKLDKALIADGGSDTPFATNNWQPLKMTMTANSASIVETSSLNLNLFHAIVVNPSSLGGEFRADAYSETSKTVEKQWSNSNVVSTTETISVDLLFGSVGGGGASSAISFEQSWGSSETYSATEIVGVSSGITLFLGPGQSVEVTLAAVQKKADLEITYKCALSGDVAFRTEICVVGCTPLYWQKEQINALQAVAHRYRMNQFVTESMEVGFYTDIFILIEDYNPPGNNLRRSEQPTAVDVTTMEPSGFINGIPVYDLTGTFQG